MTAVSQAATPVVTAIQASPAASPGRPAARVSRTRAAAAEPAAAVERAATAVQPAANGVAAAVESASSGAATAVETASKSELPRRAAAVVRVASKHAATSVRTAPKRAAAVGGAPKRLDAAVNTVAKLGSIATNVGLARERRDGAVTGEPSRIGGVNASSGAALPATATGDALRHATLSGWRNATADREAPTQSLGRFSDGLTGSAAPTTQPGSPSSAATGLSGAAAMALLGLLLSIVAFGSQRLGVPVWLRTASAPASPFLALPERPG